MTTSAVVMVVCLAAARTVESQAPVSGIETLVNLVSVGERVEATSISGRRLKGSVEPSTAASLTIRRAGQRETLAASEIFSVAKVRADSLANGAAIGAGFGALGGLAAILEHCGGSSEEGDCYLAGLVLIVPLFSGGGAGVGAIADAFLPTREVVYSRSSAGGHARLVVTPVVAPTRQSVVLSVSF